LKAANRASNWYDQSGEQTSYAAVCCTQGAIRCFIFAVWLQRYAVLRLLLSIVLLDTNVEPRSADAFHVLPRIAVFWKDNDFTAALMTAVS